MDKTTQPGGAEIGAAGATAIAPDTLTAELLAKHAAGERLTPAGYGKLGAFAAKTKAIFSRKPFVATGPAVSPAPAGHAPGVGSLAAVETPNGGMAAVPIDAGVVRRTAGAVLKRADAITVRWLENAAIRAGATGPTLDRFRAAAALSPDDRQLLVDLSPDIAAELGVDPRKFPVFTAVGVLGLHATNIWLAIDELKRMEAARTKSEPARLVPGVAGPGVPGTTIGPVALPDPPRPANAPGVIMGKSK